MKIGELALATACEVETIRYYERAGLLPEPARSDGNYRVYADAHLERLRFIRRCRALDMSLDEIRQLLELSQSTDGRCDAVDGLIRAHLEHVEIRMRELRELKKQLRALVDGCAESGALPDCGVLRGLSTAAAIPAAERGHVPRTHRR